MLNTKKLIDASPELLYVNWNNDVNAQPFFITKDNAKNVIVISVRGTMSSFDVLTDIKGSAKEIRNGVRLKPFNNYVLYFILL